MSRGSQFLEQIEFAKVLELIEPYVRTPMGRTHLWQRQPMDELASIESEQARVDEMRRGAVAQGRLPITEVVDPAAALAELRVAGRRLDAGTVRDVVTMLVVARDAARVLSGLDPEDFPTLGGLWAQFPDMQGPIDAIDGMIAPDGSLEDDASPELARLRQRIRHLSERIKDVLEELIRAEWTDPVLRDDYITVRNDRFVLPVRTDTPRRFPGIVHGASATDKTLFVEPIESVETNNDLVSAREDERREVERILTSYTEMLRADRNAIEATAATLAEVDLLDAIASWAEGVEGCMPVVAEEEELALRGARHPILESSLATEEGRAVVPIDVAVGDDSRVLVISGPNAGGKTVAMKTVGLLAAMAHAGLPVPAAEARFPHFREMMADIGDQQSVDGGLSTFSSHVARLAAMLDRAAPPALLLIDEIGTGTDPAEGAALGIAILDRLRRAGLHVVATTHHLALKSWAYSTAGVVNAAVEFDEETIKPTYRLVPGVAGASIGLTMAEQLGLPAEVVRDARGRLDPAGAEAAAALDRVRGLASQLEDERAALARERLDWRGERESRERDLRERESAAREAWQERLDRLSLEFRRAAARAISGLEAARDRKKLESQARAEEARIKREVVAAAGVEPEQEAAPSGWSPAEGERVHVASLRRDGLLRRLEAESAQVELGRSLFTVRLSDLRPPAAGGEAGPAKMGDASRGPSSVPTRDRTEEIVLVGERVEAARERLEKFLDAALLAGADRVRIVHGRGTGRLREAVRELLSEHPAIDRFESAPAAEGGDAVTWACVSDSY